MTNPHLKDIKQAFEGTSDIFFSNRAEGDLDMIQEVRHILQTSGLANEAAIAFDTNQYIIDAVNIGPEGQRFLLNRFWNLQLLALGVSSIEERFCLVETGPYSDWIRLFKSKIVPCLVKHRLPKVL